MTTDRLDVRTDDGRRIAVWRDADPAVGRRVVAVLSPGFCRRMRNVGAISLYLATNGVVVYRFDPLDHPGLSDGDLRDFTLTGAQASIAAVLRSAAALERVDSVVTVGVSLLARPMLRVAVSEPLVGRVVMIAGVVDVRSTAKRALGGDYVGMRAEELPETVSFERHTLGALPFYRDIHDGDWADVEGTLRDLTRIGVPVVAFHASEDAWAELGDVRHLLDADQNRGPRYLFELPYGEHSLEKNPVALKIVLSQVTRAVIAPSLDGMDSVEVVVPPFERLIELAVVERERERVERQAAEGVRSYASDLYQPAVRA